jgi:hypothetical protein
LTSTKRLALCGVFAGLSLAVMWMISFIPTMDYALPAAAGMLTVFLVIEMSRRWAFGVFLVAALLSFLLLPSKTVPMLYASFFGYYPILKALLEEKLPRPLEWLCKQLAFNAAMAGTYWLGTKLFGLEFDDFGEEFGKYAPWILLGLGNGAFLLYDRIILNALVTIYLRRWQKRFARLLK